MSKGTVELSTDKIHRYVWIGRKDKDWYSRCQETLIELFGEEKLPLVCKLLAATSINSALKSNITLFRKAMWEIEHNKPVGNYLPVMKKQIEVVRDGGDLSGRKIRNFAAAMSGDQNAVVVDTWVVRAFEVDKKYFRKESNIARSGGVQNNVYTACEDWIKTESTLMQLQPRELCAMIWAGVRIYKGGDVKTEYNDFLRRKLTNLFKVI